MVEFKAGDNAVYPGYGVGKVTAVETKEIMGTSQTFYVIKIEETGMKVLVPKDKRNSAGLRAVINSSEADKVIDILKRTDVKIDKTTWNRRYREYVEKIKTGSIFEIAEVLRDLFLLKVDKELSFGERQMLEKARNLLLKELALATSKEDLKGSDVGSILGL